MNPTLAFQTWVDEVTGIRCAMRFEPPSDTWPAGFWCGYIELVEYQPSGHPFFHRGVDGSIVIDDVIYVGFDTAHPSDFDAEGLSRWTEESVRREVASAARAAVWHPGGRLTAPAEDRPMIHCADLTLRHPRSLELIAQIQREDAPRGTRWTWSHRSNKKPVFCRRAASSEEALCRLEERGVPLPPARVLRLLLE